MFLLSGTALAASGGTAKPASTEPLVAPADQVQPSRVDVKVGTERPAEAAPVVGQEQRAEELLLQKLSERRKKLEELERQIQTREALINAVEQKVIGKVDELKAVEQAVRDSAAAPKDSAQTKQIADLARMYEAMKPKDAARIMEEHDLELMTSIARQIPSKKLADIVSKMAPERANKLATRMAAAPVVQ